MKFALGLIRQARRPVPGHAHGVVTGRSMQPSIGSPWPVEEPTRTVSERGVTFPSDRVGGPRGHTSTSSDPPTSRWLENPGLADRRVDAGPTSAAPAEVLHLPEGHAVATGTARVGLAPRIEDAGTVAPTATIQATAVTATNGDTPVVTPTSSPPTSLSSTLSAASAAASTSTGVADSTTPRASLAAPTSTGAADSSNPGASSAAPTTDTGSTLSAASLAAPTTSTVGSTARRASVAAPTLTGPTDSTTAGVTSAGAPAVASTSIGAAAPTLAAGSLAPLTPPGARTAAPPQAAPDLTASSNEVRVASDFGAPRGAEVADASRVWLAAQSPPRVDASRGKPVRGAPHPRAVAPAAPGHHDARDEATIDAPPRSLSLAAASSATPGHEPAAPPPVRRVASSPDAVDTARASRVAGPERDPSPRGAHPSPPPAPTPLRAADPYPRVRVPDDGGRLPVRRPPEPAPVVQIGTIEVFVEAARSAPGAATPVPARRDPAPWSSDLGRRFLRRF